MNLREKARWCSYLRTEGEDMPTLKKRSEELVDARERCSSSHCLKALRNEATCWGREKKKSLFKAAAFAFVFIPLPPVLEEPGI